MIRKGYEDRGIIQRACGVCGCALEVPRVVAGQTVNVCDRCWRALCSQQLELFERQLLQGPLDAPFPEENR